MKYTFLLPAYKARFFEEALQSILRQTFTDFCVIISDDASPEPIEDIVRRFNDPRISFRRRSVNLGGANLVKHWNLLLDICESEFVIVASDDDMYAPTFLEQVDKLVEARPDVDLFRVAVDMIDENGKTFRKESVRKTFLSSEGFIYHLLDPNSILCVGNYVMRTSRLKEMGGFVSFPLAWKADSATLLALSRHGVAVSEKNLFSFRMSGINISSQSVRRSPNDRQKLLATLAFNSWMETHVSADILSRVGPSVKQKLEGEIRSYYACLSWGDFARLYRKMVREGYFYTLKKKMSFVRGWLLQKIPGTKFFPQD